MFKAFIRAATPFGLLSQVCHAFCFGCVIVTGSLLLSCRQLRSSVIHYTMLRLVPFLPPSLAPCRPPAAYIVFARLRVARAAGWHSLSLKINIALCQPLYSLLRCWLLRLVPRLASNRLAPYRVAASPSFLGLFASPPCSTRSPSVSLRGSTARIFGFAEPCAHFTAVLPTLLIKRFFLQKQSSELKLNYLIKFEKSQQKFKYETNNWNRFYNTFHR